MPLPLVLHFASRAFALALPAFREPLAVSCRIGSSVKRAWRLPRRTAGNQPIVDQCLDPSVTTTSVGSGSCGSRRFRLASLQLATFTTLACAPEPAASAGSTMLSPLLSRKNCAPRTNCSASEPLDGCQEWPRPGIGSESCADVNFIAHSYRSSIRFVFNATQRPGVPRRADRAGHPPMRRPARREWDGRQERTGLNETSFWRHGLSVGNADVKSAGKANLSNFDQGIGTTGRFLNRERHVVNRRAAGRMTLVAAVMGMTVDDSTHLEAIDRFTEP
jgi:hypothetical protein